MKKFLLLIAIVVIAGCTQQPADTSVSESQLKSCSLDADCIKVDTTCCPCSMGGGESAINKAYEDYWNAKVIGKCPLDTVCPQVYLCTDSISECIEGRCLLVEKERTKIPTPTPAISPINETDDLDAALSELEQMG